MAGNAETHSGEAIAHVDMVAGHAETGSGMPQLDFVHWPHQIFWLLVGIGVMYYVLSKIAFPRIARILEERHNTISADLDRAAALKKKAEEAEAAYTKALNDARAEAQSIVAETRNAIQKDLNVAMQEADAQIAAKAAESEKQIAEIRANAEEGVRKIADDITADIIGSVLSDGVDDKVIQKAIENQLKG